MTIEQARVRAVAKPWGRRDLAPWSGEGDGHTAIGELWFDRADPAAPETALLLKLLFTAEPLSIQVHPDDAHAHALGLANGKTEAWYVLSAEPESALALGLKQPLTAAQLRAAIEDASIVDRVDWRPAAAGDTVPVPAGTIHAIGAGLVLAEIQQRSDTTFRLYDYGRGRPLHVDEAVAVAIPGIAPPAPPVRRLDGGRTRLVVCPAFVLDRLDLAPGSTWDLATDHETWLLVLAGRGRIDRLDARPGAAFFQDAGRATVVVGAEGLTLLMADSGREPRPGLLLRHAGTTTTAVVGAMEAIT